MARRHSEGHKRVAARRFAVVGAHHRADAQAGGVNSGSSKRVFAILDALRHFSHDRRTLWRMVFEFDRRGKFVLFRFHELKRFLDWRVSVTPWEVVAAVRFVFSILHVHADDAVVIFLQKWDRLPLVPAV